MSSVDEILILALEEQLFDRVTRRSQERLDALLADDCIVVGGAGKTFDRGEAIVAMLAAPDRAVTLSDFRVRTLSPGLYLTTYCTGDRLRSSIWRRETLEPDGARVFRVVFHQTTPT